MYEENYIRKIRIHICSVQGEENDRSNPNVKDGISDDWLTIPIFHELTG